MHTPIRHPLRPSFALFTLIFTLLVLLVSGDVAQAQNPPTGPAGGVLSGTYPNPTLAEDRVRRTGDIMSGGLSINIPNSGGLVYPVTMGSSGAAAAGRGISFQFSLPLSGLSALGGEWIAARESTTAHSFMSFSTHNGTAVSEAFRITSGGNVGIGTTTPGARLVTFGNLLAGNINTHSQLYSGFDAQQNVIMELGYGTATGNITPLPVFVLSKNLTNANQGLGSIAFVNSNIANGSEKRLSAIGTYTDGALNSGALTLSTSTAGVLTERMRFTSNGRVGINTTAPAHGLDVVGSGVWLARFKRTDNSNGGIMIESPTGFNPNVALAVNGTNKWHLLSNSSSNDVLQFWESTGSQPRFTLTQAGTVGIGTPSPSSLYKLDVQGGTINTSGGLCIAGICKANWSEVGSSQWANGSGGAINYGGGSVGIGITSPLFSLDVSGGANGFRAKAATTSASDAIAVFENNSGFQMIVRGNGNVGIGNNSPGSKLFVGSGTPAGTTLPGMNVALGGPTYVSASNGTENMFMGTDGSGYGIVGTFTNHAVGIRTNNTERIRIDNSGLVGIGTGTPSERLEVNGNLKVIGTGNITATGTIEGNNVKAKYQDLAEWVDSSQELASGTVVILDDSKSNHVIASTQSYDSRVAGVISAQPGIALGEEGEGRVLVATTGRVKVKVDATNGPIRIGDLLVTSDREGVAMKSIPVELGGVRMHRPGTLIGKALEPLAQGTGEILVLLSLQ